MKRIPLIALLIAVALPVTGAAAKTAYFKVRIAATQSIDWKRDETVPGCGSGFVHITGRGTSTTNVLPQYWEPVTVKQAGSSVRFLFDGKQPDLPVFGRVNRQGDQQATGSGPASPSCGMPIPTPPDCGERSYPGDSRIALLWNTPADWSTSDGRKPGSPSLHLRGPYGPSLTAGIGYQNCIGERDDYKLGILSSSTMGFDSGSAPLPLAKLFGKKFKRFTVRGGITGSVPHYEPPGVTGGWDSRLTLGWRVEFKRLAKPGTSDHIKPAPLT